MKEKGNIKSNVLYNPNEARHPPPTNMMDSERDSELERFIRSKYEFKRFMDRKSGSTSQQPVADRTASITSRPRSTPLTDSAQIGRKTSPGPLPPPKTPQNLPPRLHLSTTIPSLSHTAPPPTRSISQPLPPLANSDKLTTAPPLRQPAARQPTIQKPAGQVWEDLISLQEPSQSSSLPLQYSPMNPTTSFPSQPQVPVQQQPTTTGNGPNPFVNLSLGQANATTPLVASPIPALYLGTTNPFNQARLLSSPAAGMNGTAFSTGSNSLSSSPYDRANGHVYAHDALCATGHGTSDRHPAAHINSPVRPIANIYANDVFPAYYIRPGPRHGWPGPEFLYANWAGRVFGGNSSDCIRNDGVHEPATETTTALTATATAGTDTWVWRMGWAGYARDILNVGSFALQRWPSYVDVSEEEFSV
ncbi:hypothetical protein J3R83DRAFT_13597 [Lanmaoa asiatica]|nr:hypothetical protein J3R83DRAFT_13597 [Lanmaoa asiatica]